MLISSVKFPHCLCCHHFLSLATDNNFHTHLSGSFSLYSTTNKDWFLYSSQNIVAFVATIEGIDARNKRRPKTPCFHLSRATFAASKREVIALRQTRHDRGLAPLQLMESSHEPSVKGSGLSRYIISHTSSCCCGMIRKRAILLTSAMRGRWYSLETRELKWRNGGNVWPLYFCLSCCLTRNTSTWFASVHPASVELREAVFWNIPADCM